MPETDVYRPKAGSLVAVPQPMPSDRAAPVAAEDAYTRAIGHLTEDPRIPAVHLQRGFADLFSDLSTDLVLRSYRDLPLDVSRTWSDSAPLLVHRLALTAAAGSIWSYCSAAIASLGEDVFPNLALLAESSFLGDEDYRSAPVEWGRLTGADVDMIESATQVDYSRVEVIPRVEDDD